MNTFDCISGSKATFNKTSFLVIAEQT
jgi:hypothetical protein